MMKTICDVITSHRILKSHNNCGLRTVEPCCPGDSRARNLVLSDTSSGVANKWIIWITIILWLSISFSGCIDSTNEYPPRSIGFEVHFLDVGQGDAVFIRYQRTDTTFDIMIDTGPNNSAARKELNQAISTYQIYDLDYLILTHPDADHIGNAKYLLESIPVQSVFRSGFVKSTKTYQELDEWLGTHTTTVITTEGEGIARWPHNIIPDDYFTFSVLYANSSAKEANDASLVVYIRWYDEDFLFLGDIDQGIEKNIIEDYAYLNWPTIDYLKVSHHGSRYSTSAELLATTIPKHAIISCARENQYGHPHEETIQRLQDYNCKIFTTFENGIISYINDSNAYDNDRVCVSTER